MTVQELINELTEQDPGAEVGYEVRTDGMDLLIGDDTDAGLSIFIPRPAWPA